MSEPESDGFALDPRVEAELESIQREDPSLTTLYSQGDGGADESLDLLRGWIPDADAHQGKTVISPHQAQALAIVRHIGDAYALLGVEIEGLDEFLEGMVGDYEQYLTSIEGVSRKQQMKVLMAMFGQDADEEEAKSWFWKMAGSNMDDGE